MSNLNLTPRLAATASLVVGGGTVVDIGTDHAYLPAFLIQQGKVNSAIAVDVRKSPLENAKETVLKYNLQDKITLRLSDGLAEIKENEADEVIFAGMGGTLISEKLSECNWIKNQKYHFIFQPQSKAEDLREYLFKNGFTINKEVAVSEGRRYYIALDAVYSGENIEYSLSDCFIGKLPKTEEAKVHLTNQLNRLEKKYNALKERDESNSEVEALEILINDLKGFIYG